MQSRAMQSRAMQSLPAQPPIIASFFQVVSPLSTTALCIFEAPTTETGWRIAVGFDTGELQSRVYISNESACVELSAVVFVPPVEFQQVSSLFEFKFLHHSCYPSGVLRVMEGDLDTIIHDFFRFGKRNPVSKSSDIASRSRSGQ
jgi:hypothetical protein